MIILKHIPNLLTCCNLLTGCLALVEVFYGRLENVIFYVLISGLFDFFDGFAARLLNVSSAIGKDLDSLADMVSFSVVPAFLMYQMIEQFDTMSYLKYSGLAIAALSAIRLAKFNNDVRQSDTFYGLPVPANALFCCALPILYDADILSALLSNSLGLAIISIVMAFTLVMDVRLLALKFKGFAWQDNKVRYLFILISLVGMATFQLIAIPFIIVLYVATSLFINFFNSNN